MNRRRVRGSLWRLFTEYTKPFLNVILHHVRDDSGFSRPNVSRYETLLFCPRKIVWGMDTRLA